MTLLKGREMVYIAFESEIFSLSPKKIKKIRIIITIIRLGSSSQIYVPLPTNCLTETLPPGLGERAMQKKIHNGTGIKILPPKQLLGRLSIHMVQVQAEKTSENLPNEIR